MKKQQNYTLIFIVKPFIILLCVICFLYFFPVKRAIDISFVPEPITPSLSYGKQVTVLCEPIRNDNMRTPVDSFILVAIQNENGIFEKLPTNIDGTPVLSNGNHVVINTQKAGTLDFSGVPAFFVTMVLLVQCSAAIHAGFR